ncbi:MAD2L1-binding protein [Rhinoraja longicauda]
MAAAQGRCPDGGGSGDRDGGSGGGPELEFSGPGEGEGPGPQYGTGVPGEEGLEPGVEGPGPAEGGTGPGPDCREPVRPVWAGDAKPACGGGGGLGPGRRSSIGARPDADLSVVFPGQVTQRSCCRLVCELLKHVLYQRQQLPLPYDQLAFFSRRDCGPDDSSMMPRSLRNVQNNCKKSQRILLELEEVFQNLETLFMLTLVPCMHILLGGSVVNPKEMYEVNMEQVAFGSSEESLKTISCIRQLFHTLFIKDLFNELKSAPLMNTVLLVQAQRNCGIQWFRPKLNYRVPTRTRRLIISMASDTVSLTSAMEQRPSHNNDDYIWFQAPITIKGFHYL